MIKGHDKIVTVFFYQKDHRSIKVSSIALFLAGKKWADDYPINLRRRKNRTIRPKSNIIIDASPELLWTTAHPPPPLLAWGGVTTAGGGELTST
jgi:hypothetical protein